MSIKPESLQPSRRGAAAVEMAILAPVFITLVLACVDFGRFAYTYIAVTNAARAAAGYAIMNPFSATTKSAWDAAVHQAAVDEMQQMRALYNNTTDFFDVSKLTVQGIRTIETSGNGAGLWYVSVEIHYPFQTFVNWSFPIPFGGGARIGLPSSIDLDRTVVLRGIR